MMQTEFIPIHDLTATRKDDLAFRYIPLSQRSNYDTSLAHRHSYYEIFLFDKGGGLHEIDFQTHIIGDYSIHFVSPGQVHKVRREPDTYGSILLFSRDFYHLGAQTSLSLFDYPFLNTLAGSSPVVTLSKEQFDELQLLSVTMGSEKNGEGTPNLEVIRSYLHIFLLKCKQYSEAQAQHSGIKEATLLFNKLKQLLEHYYRQEHAVTFYADQLTVSFKKLNELCKLYSGLTMNSLIRDRLILEARRLLLHSEYSIKEISYYLGFEDPAYFNRFFRKNIGMSAGSFRKSGNKEEGDN